MFVIFLHLLLFFSAFSDYGRLIVSLLFFALVRFFFELIILFLVLDKLDYFVFSVALKFKKVFEKSWIFDGLFYYNMADIWVLFFFLSQ